MVPDAFSEEDLQKLELIAFVLSHPLYVKLSAEKTTRMKRRPAANR